VKTRKPCSLLTGDDLESLRNVEGHMDTAVLFEGCDELPEFARFTRALEKQRLVDTYGDIKTRLAENIAGVWCACLTAKSQLALRVGPAICTALPSFWCFHSLWWSLHVQGP
jgi:hypothetical protein